MCANLYLSTYLSAKSLFDDGAGSSVETVLIQLFTSFWTSAATENINYIFNIEQQSFRIKFYNY